MSDTSDARDTQKIERGEKDLEAVEAAGGEAAGRGEGEVDPTVARPPVEASAPRPKTGDEAAPALHDVAGTLRGYARGRVAALRAFVLGHRVATAVLALLAAVAVACLAIAFARAGSVPGAGQVEQDARGVLSVPEYEGGTFGSDDALVLRAVDVRSVARSATTPEGATPRFGASGYAEAEVVASYEGAHVLADQAATLWYACVDGVWELIGDASDAQVAWQPRTGVDQDKALANVRLLLERAGEGLDDGAALARTYEGATTKVARDSFDPDADTDELVLTCERSGAFESYSCELTASFSFDSANGRWTLGPVGVSDGALERSLDPIVGTWAGTFRSQETDGTKCLAGRKTDLVVSVTGASADTLTGTISGVAHYHEHPADDAENCEGDLALEDVPFTARLVEGADGAGEAGTDGAADAGASGGALEFVAELPEDVDGTARLTLTFGSAEDETLVTARVETSYQHTGSILFIPYDETLTYTDLFTLTRAE